jgi:hypothetical protein
MAMTKRKVEAEMTVTTKKMIEFNGIAALATRSLFSARESNPSHSNIHNIIRHIYSLAMPSSSFTNSSASIFCSCCHETLNTLFSFVVKLNK